MKILYATDGFPPAAAAARLADRLFRREGAMVTVTSVTPSHSIDPDELLLQLDPIEKRREDSAKIVEHAAEELAGSGFKTATLVLEGHPGHELVRNGEEAGSDVIVLGAGSHSWMGNKLLGSVSTHVLHEATCSVVVVHESGEGTRRGRAIVGVDGSAASEASVGVMTNLLDPQRCAIDVIGVIQLQLPMVAPMPMGTFAVDEHVLKQEEEILRGHAERHVAAATARLRDAGFEVSSDVVVGNPTPALLDHAQASDADLLTVGSRGLGAVSRAFLGSVSDQVARLAPATLVVKGPTA